MILRAVFGAAMLTIPAAAFAEEVVAFFNNQGQCMSAWNALNNEIRAEMRETQTGVSQRKSVGSDFYVCVPRGERWVLLKV